MRDLVADYGHITWSGQHDSNEVAAIVSASGRKPYIIAADLIEYSPSRIQFGANPADYVERYLGLERAGHAHSVMWHWNAPTNLINQPGQEWWRGFYTDSTSFDVAAALANTNSPEYALLLRDIDAIAVQLKKFSSNNFPVLWRPLHEAEGGWFWWGAKGPEPFKQLWRLLYQRLTAYHGLNNLIWVFTTSSSLSASWYPGNDVVDVVGTDAYPTDSTDALSGTWQTLLSQFNGTKLLALTEFGGVPDIEKMQRFGVWWSWYAPWTGTYGPSSAPTSTVTRIYQSSAVLTLDEANAIPPRILSLTRQPNGQMEMIAKGPRGQTNRVFVTPDVTLPIGSWSGIYTDKFFGGVFTWIDSQSTTNPVRFYRLRSN
jgi:mannan endo-1,4-beta-mannosidase